jgi:hypothetical protein
MHCCRSRGNCRRPGFCGCRRFWRYFPFHGPLGGPVSSGGHIRRASSFRHVVQHGEQQILPPWLSGLAKPIQRRSARESAIRPFPARNAAVQGGSKLLFRWRWAVASHAGPPSPTTRLVLLALSLHMQDDGSGAFPSEATLASKTALSDRAVRTHLALAARDGWIGRKKPRAKGRAWANYHYWATMPAGIPGAEAGAGAGRVSPEPPTQRAETQSGEVRKDVPPNSAVNSSINAKERLISPAGQAVLDEWSKKYAKTHRLQQ